jgi:DNA-binding transcriptional LysR family regulator
MDRLGQMEALVRVAEAGSFSGAARELGVGQPAVSKAIAALESRLGVRLIHRSPTGMMLTEVGMEYLERARAVIDLVDDADATARHQGGALRGTIRVTTSTAFGRLKLTGPLLAFLRAHPEVDARLVLADGDLDLAAEGIDVALRIGRLPDSTLAARRVGVSPRITVAAPAYLERHGTPRHPRDLVDHECIVYERLRRGRRWYFEGPDGPQEVTVRGRFRTDGSEAARIAIVEGFGIGHVPRWLCADALRDGSVVPLFPRHRSELLPVHAVFPERRLIARRTRLLVDALGDAFAADPDLVEPPRTRSRRGAS